MPKQRNKPPEKKQTENYKDNRGAVEKINLFFKQNNYMIVILLVLLNALTLYLNNSYKSDTIKELKESVKYIKKNLSTVGYLTATGQLITTKRKAISYDDERIKNTIVNIVSEPFLLGAMDLTKDYTEPRKTLKDMVENNEAMKRLYENYTLNKKSVKKAFSKIHSLLKNAFYPEYITIMKKKIHSFSISRQSDGSVSFTTNVQYDIVTKSWITQIQKYKNERKTLIMRFDGVVNPEKYADAENLLGFKITKVVVPSIIKPKLSSLNISQNANN